MVRNALVGGGRLLGAEQHAMRLECGQSRISLIPDAQPAALLLTADD